MNNGSPFADALSRILVTGASGFLGWTLCGIASKEHEVTGVYGRHPVEIPSCRTGKLDLRDYRAMKDTLKDANPEIVIHTAALSDANVCQEDASLSRAVNVDASANLAGLCADAGRVFVYTSSDLVFDGLSAPYREDAPPKPVSRYGEHKALAEEKVLERYPDAGVFRLPLMFGEASPWSKNFSQTFLAAMRAGKELRLFRDEFRTPLNSETGSRAVLKFMGRRGGRLHLGGKDRVSRLELGEMMASELGIATAKIVACSQKDVPMAAPRPPDVSLDSSLAFSLGYDPPPVRAQVAALKGRV